MPDDKPTEPQSDAPDKAADIVPEIEVEDNPAEAIREKGEPFDGNLA